MSKSILSAILLISIIGAVAFLLLPKNQEFKVLQEKLKAKKDELQYKEQYLLSLKEASEELEKYKEELAKVDSAIPSNSSLPALFAFIQKETQYNGLVPKNLGSFVVNVVPANPTIKETHLDFEVSGNYASIKDFLHALEKSARLIELENISLGSETKTTAPGSSPSSPTSAEETKKEASLEATFKIKVHSY